VGDKIRSREVVEKVGVPIIPGMKESFDRLEDYLAAAQKIGYPVMIKASAGGGGKGMRIVYQEDAAKLRRPLETSPFILKNTSKSLAMLNFKFWLIIGEMLSTFLNANALFSVAIRKLSKRHRRWQWMIISG